MTAEHRPIEEPDVKGNLASERRFLRDANRYRGTRKIDTYWKAILATSEQRKGDTVKDPGYFQQTQVKLRAQVEAAKRHAWSLVSTRPFDTDRQRYTYRVKKGELTITDRDGQVLHRHQDERLEKYNGVTLSGTETGNGKTTIASGIRTQFQLDREQGPFAGTREIVNREIATVKAIPKGMGILARTGIGAVEKGATQGVKAGYKQGKVVAKAGYATAQSVAAQGVKQGRGIAKQVGEGILSLNQQPQNTDIPRLGSSMEIGQERGVGR